MTVSTQVILTLVVAIAVGRNAAAEESSCPLENQQPMLIVQMFFGQSIRNRGPVTVKEWNSFLRQTVTPRFPDGFTVYDGYGQWLDTKTHAVVREKAKVVVIATQEMARKSLLEIAETYRKQFDQQSVGIVTNSGCGAF
jgi:hypothetical protein